MSERKRLARRAAVLAWAIVLGGGETKAEPAITLLTPPVDTCRAYTAAVFGDEKRTLTGLSGWFLGFLSGMAQGTGIDFLRNADVEKLNHLLYDGCRAQPDRPLSVAAEEIAKSLIASHQNQQR
jgi:hypothetical protein